MPFLNDESPVGPNSLVEEVVEEEKKIVEIV